MSSPKISFGPTLQSAIEATGGNQTSFAAKIGVNPNGLNQIVRGKKPAGAAMMRKVVENLPKPWSTRVLIAWLYEATPLAMRDDITIAMRRGPIEGCEPTEEEVRDWSHLDRRRKSLVNWVIDKIPKATFADWLESNRAVQEQK